MFSSMVYLKKRYYHENNKKNSCSYNRSRSVLAPMALMVGAVDTTPNTGSYCGNCETNNVFTTSPNTVVGAKIYLHTTDFCFELPILTSVTKCHNRGQMYAETITYRKFGHVDVYQHPANGRWTCYECGYQIY